MTGTAGATAATTSATPLLDGLVAFLRDDGWPVTVPAAGPVPTVETRCAGTSLEWSCTGRTFEQQGQVVFDSTLPLSVPEARRPGIALLLAKANWSLHTGAFALDPATGELRLRTSLVVTGEPQLPAAAAKALVYANVLIVDRCVPAVAGAVSGEVSVADALDRLHL